MSKTCSIPGIELSASLHMYYLYQVSLQKYVVNCVNKKKKNAACHCSSTRIKPLTTIVHPRKSALGKTKSMLSFVHCPQITKIHLLFSCCSCVWLFLTLWIVDPGLLCPWDSPGKNTGVGCHFLLQANFLELTQTSNLSLLLGRWILYH